MEYTPPFFLFNNHLETIYPSLFRSVDFQYDKKERIPTPDDDFLEIAWSSCKADSLVIISHGLEGDYNRQYIRGMAKACLAHGIDVLAWNYRGCGTDMNKQLRFYHSGATDDLDTVIQHALDKKCYTSINLIGFSLGGNITLKYLGESRERSAYIQKGIAFSVPIDLKASCATISSPGNGIYHNRFLKSLKHKVITKSALMKGLDITGIDNIRTLKEFDDRYTAPLHGFHNADEYYFKCSSLRVVAAIKNTTLIVNAANDPFLSPECYPHELLKDHAYVTFETPRFGGHVGFSQFNKENLYWSEKRAIEFLTTPSHLHMKMT